MVSLFADIDWTDMAGLGVGFFMLVVVPLVYIFLNHQRKMASFFHQGAANPNQQAQLDRLEAEVRDLKAGINHLILQADDRRELQRRMEPPKMPDQLQQ